MPANESALLFSTATPRLSRRRIRAFARRLELEVARGGSFCCLITTDRELSRLNREFRLRDYPTDVLSFPAGRASARVVRGDGGQFLGEIAISLQTAARQARDYGHSLDEEVEILMLHGLLHLLGMDHETDGGRMSAAEKRWRSRLGLPAGLIERVSA